MGIASGGPWTGGMPEGPEDVDSVVTCGPWCMVVWVEVSEFDELDGEVAL